MGENQMLQRAKLNKRKHNHFSLHEVIVEQVGHTHNGPFISETVCPRPIISECTLKALSVFSCSQDITPPTYGPDVTSFDKSSRSVNIAGNTVLRRYSR